MRSDFFQRANEELTFLIYHLQFIIYHLANRLLYLPELIMLNEN
jgi:hypothetical protein